MLKRVPPLRGLGLLGHVNPTVKTVGYDLSSLTGLAQSTSIIRLLAT
jgi:hypothetical protein